MKRRGGPIQQWVDSIPSPTKSTVDIQIDCDNHSSMVQSTPEHSKHLIYNNNPIMTLSTPISVPNSPAITMSSIPSPGAHSRLARDPSFQSDSSHCSSVESLLELRRADPEAILLGLGFGGCPKASQDNGPLSRIPKRFLQPSKLKGITINDFVKQQQETTESIDSASLGYRGLTGSPYVAPSEIVQKIMERLREHESHELDAYTVYNSETCSNVPVQEGRLSVLSPDNRQFLDRQRSKSPDMRNKRMIIGKKSFAFSHDGDLIEINTSPSIETPDYADDQLISYPSGSINDSNYDQSPLTPQISISDDIGESSSLDSSPSFSDKIPHNHGEIENVCSDEIEIINRSSMHLPINIKFYDRDNPDCNSDSDAEFSRSSSSPRRASESSCDIREIPVNSNRRFSDGKIHPDKSQKNGRRSLQRQARIIESDSPDFIDSDSHVLNDKSYDFSSPSDSSSFKILKSSLPRKKVTKQTFCDPKKRHLCCKNDNERVCRHDERSEECCYHKNTVSCWKKMRKIMEKNEKLENMVVKSRREMAEIREMLNNVLSVRMEPGF